MTEPHGIASAESDGVCSHCGEYGRVTKTLDCPNHHRDYLCERCGGDDD